MVKFWEMLAHQEMKTLFLIAVQWINWISYAENDGDDDEDDDDDDDAEDDDDDDEVHTWRHATQLAFVSR